MGRLILNVLTIALVFMSFRSAQATERAVLMPQALKNEIVTREAWGSKPKPIPADRKQKPLWITLHHAGELFHEGKDDPAEFVRKMQIWGQNRPKLEKPPRDTYWPDLPYHFLIAPDGRIFEGRPVDYEPESNTRYPLKGNIGVEMMGDFNVQQPTLKQIRSCVLLTAWLCRRYHIACDRIRTHQDVAPGQTDCPGKNFYCYIKDGQFIKWVNEALASKEPSISLTFSSADHNSNNQSVQRPGEDSGSDQKNP